MRAEDGSRTRYLQLGRLSLCQMSYFRKEWGEEDSNLRRLRQQIYSLPHLTALESPRAFSRADRRTRTADRLITNQLLYQLSYIGTCIYNMSNNYSLGLGLQK